MFPFLDFSGKSDSKQCLIFLALIFLPILDSNLHDYYILSTVRGQQSEQCPRTVPEQTMNPIHLRAIPQGSQTNYFNLKLSGTETSCFGKASLATIAPQRKAPSWPRTWQLTLLRTQSQCQCPTRHNDMRSWAIVLYADSGSWKRPETCYF